MVRCRFGEVIMAKKKKILVIEDETNLGKSIQRFLGQHNYNVTCISEGIKEVEDIRKEEPDLILTDLLLPRLHGFDICKIVKKDEWLKDIPLVVMTAVYKGSVQKLELKNIGVDDFIEKPLNFEELLEKINRFLGPAQPDGLSTGPQKDKKSKVQKEGEVIQQQFQDIKVDYLRQLPGKIIQLEKIWERIQKRQDTAKQLVKFRGLAHSLTGSGTSFGVKEISDNARKIELLLDMIIVEGEKTIESRRNEIDGLLDMMRHNPVVSTEMELNRGH